MLAAGDAALLRECRRHHGDLVARAAARSRPEAVLLSVDLGFDVDALRGTTALHEAAVRGETTVVDLLLELGADPSLLDTTHHATAAGWAHHGGHPQLAEHLEDVTGESAG
nr:ankyrin repeat domain-containing protein [Brachybacterium sacelli]